MDHVVAVLIPCYNEEQTIGRVVTDFRRVLPDARIFVFDNASNDRTAEIAKGVNADVVFSPHRGKGNVVRHMFEAVDADVYVMVDGDSTYDPQAAPSLIRCVTESTADMAVGARMSSYGTTAFRRFHTFGNHLVSRLISWLVGIRVTDVLSGYRAFSREFVKTVPLMSGGFEIETELTLQAAAKRFRIVEQPTVYGGRPPGSHSKLSTFSDGMLILKAIFSIFKDYKPQLFFSTLAVLFAIASALAGILPIRDFYETRYVSHVPLAILAAAFGVLAVTTGGIGLVLGTVNRYHNETFVLWRRQLGRSKW
jgi:glycosyltransferase involved in cell wall biosynthesis